MNDITQIGDSGILPEDTLKKLKEIDKDLETGFNRRQRFRPRFLMETAVLNDMKFPTPDAKYWQCNVERDTHFRNLVMASFDYKEKQADIMILEAELHELRCDEPSELTQAQIIKKEIRIAREKAILVYMKKEARERAREVLNWTDIMQKLEPDLKYDPNDIEAHMPEAYAIRYSREMEAMRIAGELNARDTSGAMNIISLTKNMQTHPEVQKLMSGSAKAGELDSGETVH